MGLPRNLIENSYDEVKDPLTGNGHARLDKPFIETKSNEDIGPTKEVVGSDRGHRLWLAEQEDLLVKRIETHGAVTYEYDGIFSYQMYDTAEANDGSGTYTEYIMRCKWGPEWKDMSPWLVARRYREFVELDKNLREALPGVGDSLLALPPKQLSLSNMLGMSAAESDAVIKERRIGLEAYIAKIVTDVIPALRSIYFMNFLNIPVRIAIIRAKLMRRDGGLPGIQSSYSTGASPDVDPRNPPFVDAVAAKTVEGDGAASSQEHSIRTQLPLVKDELITVEVAEELRRRSHPVALSLVALTHLEERVKALRDMLSSMSPQEACGSFEVRQIVRYCISRWPSLRASTHVDRYTSEPQQSQDTDSFIARVLQVEEELVLAVSYLRDVISASEVGPTAPLLYPPQPVFERKESNLAGAAASPSIGTKSETPRQGDGTRSTRSRVRRVDDNVPLSIDELISLEEAERRREAQSAMAFTEDEVAQFAAEVSSLSSLVRDIAPQSIGSNEEISHKARYCISKWPCLRATALLYREEIGEDARLYGVDTIDTATRALQVEEDLITAMSELKGSMTASLIASLEGSSSRTVPSQPRSKGPKGRPEFRAQEEAVIGISKSTSVEAPSTTVQLPSEFERSQLSVYMFEEPTRSSRPPPPRPSAADPPPP
eukprot:gene1184-1338_t